MKSKKLFSIILSICLLLLFGCKYESNKIGSKNRYTTIKLRVANGGSARTIEALDYSVYNSLVYVLSGQEILSEEEIEAGVEAEELFVKYDDLDAINSEEVSIKIATWNLSVNAYNPEVWDEEEYKKGSITPVLCFEQKNVAISPKTGSIKVEMEFNENTDERGSFEYQVYYPADEHFSVEASIYGESGEYQIKITKVEELENNGLCRVDLKAEDLNFGEYYLKLILTYEDDNGEENTYKTEPVIFISPMVETTGYYTFGNVNRHYKISYGKSENTTYNADDLPVIYKQYETKIIPAVEAEEPYYNFDGWYYSTGKGSNNLGRTEKEDYIFNEEHTFNFDITLYPIFTAKTYTLVFNANGGQGQMEPQNFTIEDEALITKNTFTPPTGKRFAGWAEALDGDVVCADESDVKGFNIGKETEINVYAVWVDKSAHLIQYENIPNGVENSNPQSYLESQDIVLSNPSARMGYTFVCWYEVVDGVVASQSPLEGWNAGSKNYDVVIQANWAPNKNTKYTVEHWQQNINDDEYTFVESEELYGTTEDQTYAEAKSYTGFKAKPISQKSITPDEKTVVVIQYDRDEISYIFDADGGLWDDDTEQKTVSGRYGSVVEAPKNPDKTGHYFTKWDAVIPETFGEKSLTFTAEWERNSYVVTYNLFNGEEYVTIKDALYYLDSYNAATLDYVVKQTGTTVKLNNYTFLGWATTEDADKADYSPGDSLEMNKHYELYSVWSYNGKVSLSITSGDNTWTGAEDENVEYEACAGAELEFVLNPSDAEVWYCTDGEDPHLSKSVRLFDPDDGRFIVSGDGDFTFKAYAVKEGMDESDVITVSITLKEFNITFDPGEAATETQVATTTTVKSGSSISVPEYTYQYYTLTEWTYGDDNLQTYTFTDNKYTVADSDMTFTAHWSYNGRTDNVIFSQAPSGTQSELEVECGTEITLSCNDTNATIYYTTDGTEPTSSSSLYSEGKTILISEDTTVKAYAENTVAGKQPSVVKSIKYKVKKGTASVYQKFISFEGLQNYSDSNLQLRATVNQDFSYTITAQAVDSSKTYTSYKWFIDGQLAMVDGEAVTGSTLTESYDKPASGETLNRTIYCLAETEDGDVDDVTYRLTVEY